MTVLFGYMAIGSVIAFLGLVYNQIEYGELKARENLFIWLYFFFFWAPMLIFGFIYIFVRFMADLWYDN